ncbi:AHH domain-containing protein [Archangium gephyra]|uniref:AHH domain-containing protein n=1 Tax=Archangium gephyra TaxID=48 RepID=UPI003B8202F1
MGKSDKHLEFLGKPVPHHPAGGLSGGKCIAKHEPPYKENCSCSHRWQAFEKALEKASQYEVTDEQVRSSGDKRWGLLFRGGAKAVTRLEKRGETVALSSENKGMYRHEVQRPQKGDWDVARGKYNFKWDCNKPYYHEAHHVVPDATLRAVIQKVFSKKPELAIRVASEMLNAPYNVHHKDNMIILPMDERVGDLLQLPIHRETKQCNHTAYDMYVEKKIETRLRAALREIMKKHDEERGEPQYKDLAKAIEEVSRATYDEVANARRAHGVTSIDEFGKKMLPSSPTSSR